MSIGAISGISGLNGATGLTSTSTAATSGTSFTDLLTAGVDKLNTVQNTASDLAVKAATGDLQNLHDYTVAASEAQTTTNVSVALRNRAIDSFTQIMQMQVG